MRVHTVIRGAGPALIFLHGVGSSLETWAGVMESLEDRYTVAAFDLLGHGLSPTPDDPSLFSRDMALEDLDELLDQLDGPAVLIGHSLGGYLALAHGATRPGVARGLIVLNTGPGFRDESKREAWNERSRRNAHRFGVAPQAAEINLQHDGVVMEQLAEMAVPTLVLAGSEDRPEYAGAGQYLQRKMPDCRFLVINGGAHDMHEAGHVDEIASIIDEFVQGLNAADGGLRR